jgi:hypothetical protein
LRRTSAHFREGEERWVLTEPSTGKVSLNSTQSSHTELDIRGSILQELIAEVNSNLGQVTCGIVVGKSSIVEHGHGGKSGLSWLGNAGKGGGWGVRWTGGWWVPERTVGIARTSGLADLSIGNGVNIINEVDWTGLVGTVVDDQVIGLLSFLGSHHSDANEDSSPDEEEHSVGSDNGLLLGFSEDKEGIGREEEHHNQEQEWEYSQISALI